jgi:hypothetical protein
LPEFRIVSRTNQFGIRHRCEGIHQSQRALDIRRRRRAGRG